jgi:hypothetical protein
VDGGTIPAGISGRTTVGFCVGSRPVGRALLSLLFSHRLTVDEYEIRPGENLHPMAEDSSP